MAIVQTKLIVGLIVCFVLLFIAFYIDVPGQLEARVRGRHNLSRSVLKADAEELKRSELTSLNKYMNKGAVPLSRLVPYSHLTEDTKGGVLLYPGVPNSYLAKKVLSERDYADFFAIGDAEMFLLYRGKEVHGPAFLATLKVANKVGKTAEYRYDPTNGSESAGTDFLILQK